MMKPRVLLFDEPSAGLSPARQDELFELIHSINPTGVTVVIVEQNAGSASKSAIAAMCSIAGGMLSTAGRTLFNDEKVVALYFGRMHRGPTRHDNTELPPQSIRAEAARRARS